MFCDHTYSGHIEYTVEFYTTGYCVMVIGMIREDSNSDNSTYMFIIEGLTSPDHMTVSYKKCICIKLCTSRLRCVILTQKSKHELVVMYKVIAYMLSH